MFSGVGVILLVFVVCVGGGIVEDVDGNWFIDLGLGIVVMMIGNLLLCVVDVVCM